MEEEKEPGVRRGTEMSGSMVDVVPLQPVSALPTGHTSLCVSGRTKKPKEKVPEKKENQARGCSAAQRRNQPLKGGSRGSRDSRGDVQSSDELVLGPGKALWL
jgi:hypothetical protein